MRSVSHGGGVVPSVTIKNSAVPLLELTERCDQHIEIAELLLSVTLLGQVSCVRIADHPKSSRTDAEELVERRGHTDNGPRFHTHYSLGLLLNTRTWIVRFRILAVFFCFLLVA